MIGCATPAPTITKPPEIVRSHIYPLPLDNVLGQTSMLMQKKGWVIKRGGTVLLTNWQWNGTALVSYRIIGQSIDAGLSAIRAEILVATRSTSFNMDHPDLADPSGRGIRAFELNPEFAADPLNDSAAGTAPPPVNFSSADLSPWVVTSRKRDAELELELQREIDPTPVVATNDSETKSGAAAPEAPPDAEPATAAQAERDQRGLGQRRPERRLTELAGIWDGTFTFKGTVVGSFTGEVTVAVDGRAVELDDFCPDNGGTFTATGATDSAAWEGNLVCSSIPIKGCAAAALTYNFAHATVRDTTLTVLAAGTVETPAGCSYPGGALSATFVARRADYVHIAVTRVKRTTSCLWPSDWEDFNSGGSMSMPDSPQDEQAYLGIIRAKGSRLTEIQKLLRHCNQVVMLNGEPVLMKLAVTRPHK